MLTNTSAISWKYTYSYIYGKVLKYEHLSNKEIKSIEI